MVRQAHHERLKLMALKQRLVSAAPFRDRVVHHALCTIIEPLFENAFIADSYANRVGKGTHAALDKAQAWMRHYPYVLQCDIRQYFPSIDHAVLESLLARKIADEQVLNLVRLIIQSGEGIHDEAYRIVYFPGDDLFAACRPRGLPIGNLTSQFWANVYFHKPSNSPASSVSWWPSACKPRQWISWNAYTKPPTSPGKARR